MNDDELDGQHAVLSVMLEELHGAWSPRDLGRDVLWRHAAGEGRQAAAAAAAATAAPPRAWLVAAMVCLGLGVLFGVAWLRSGPTPVLVQDPDKGTTVELPVHSLEELRALLPQVEAIELEVEQLRAAELPVSIGIAGAPLQVAAEQRPRVTTALADARLEEPAGWKWPNRLTLRLRGQRRVEMAIDDSAAGARLRLGLRGLQGDLSVGGDGAAALRELLAKATRAGRIAHGVVLSRRDLEGADAFPPATPEMWLFGLTDDDMRLLARFPELRSLDLSGLAKVLTTAGLHRVCALRSVQRLDLGGWQLDAARCAELVGDQDLRELVVDDCDLTDDDVAVLVKARGPLVTLSLRNNKRLTKRAIESALTMPALRLLDVRGAGANGKIQGDDQTAIASFLKPEVEIRL